MWAKPLQMLLVYSMYSPELPCKRESKNGETASECGYRVAWLRRLASVLVRK